MIQRPNLTASNKSLGLDSQEIALLAECRSQYITEYYGSHVQNTKLWIIMEFMAGGSVADMVCHLLLPFICAEKRDLWFREWF